jgi:hypothetical protein
MINGCVDMSSLVGFPRLIGAPSVRFRRRSPGIDDAPPIGHWRRLWTRMF